MVDNNYTNLGALPTAAPSTILQWGSLFAALWNGDDGLALSVQNTFYDTDLQAYSQCLTINRETNTVQVKTGITIEQLNAVATNLYALCRKYISAIVEKKRSVLSSMKAQAQHFNWMYPNSNLTITNSSYQPVGGVSLYTEARTLYTNIYNTYGTKKRMLMDMLMDMSLRRKETNITTGEVEWVIALIVKESTYVGHEASAVIGAGYVSNRAVSILSFPSHAVESSWVQHMINVYVNQIYLLDNGTYGGYWLFA